MKCLAVCPVHAVSQKDRPVDKTPWHHGDYVTVTDSFKAKEEKVKQGIRTPAIINPHLWMRML